MSHRLSIPVQAGTVHYLLAAAPCPCSAAPPHFALRRGPRQPTCARRSGKVCKVILPAVAPVALLSGAAPWHPAGTVKAPAHPSIRTNSFSRAARCHARAPSADCAWKLNAGPLGLVRRTFAKHSVITASRSFVYADKTLRTRVAIGKHQIGAPVSDPACGGSSQPRRVGDRRSDGPAAMTD